MISLEVIAAAGGCRMVRFYRDDRLWRKITLGEWKPGMSYIGVIWQMPPDHGGERTEVFVCESVHLAVNAWSVHVEQDGGARFLTVGDGLATIDPRWEAIRLEIQ